MALFRVTIDAFLDLTDTVNRDKLKDGIVAIQGSLKKANAIETSRILVQKCYHDQQPSLPCEILEPDF